MEEKLTMLRTVQLVHHPKNPRLELGDLTELAQSIKAKGILQNLTVVENPNAKDTYWVVIGNRRFEAAKLAGLDALPCRIAAMDEREQLETMIAENMQRADLTVYEQAMGFQTMMDLGYQPAQIAEKTGVSESTVRRRLKMAELDKDALKRACDGRGTDRQITLSDFERLARVDSVKERNALLKKIGSNDFDFTVKRTIARQEAEKMKPEILRRLRAAGVSKLKNQSDRYGMGYDRMYSSDVDMDEWTEDKPLIPQAEGPIWYSMEETRLSFYRKHEKPKNEAPKMSEEEKEKKRRISQAWDALQRDEGTAQALREEFAAKIPYTAKNAASLFLYLCRAALMSKMAYISCGEALDDWLEAKEAQFGKERQQKAQEALLMKEPREWPVMIYLLLEGDGGQRYSQGYKDDWPQHDQNQALDLLYEYLEANGYQMSETERALREGTHEGFQAKAED